MKTRFKKGFKKVVVLLACIFLMASFFVLPVSAAEEPNSPYIAEGLQVNFNLNKSGVSSAYAYGFGTDLETLLNQFDSHSFDELKAIYSNDLITSEGDYDYEYYSFTSQSYPLDPLGREVYGVFSLAFTGSVVTGLQSSVLNSQYVTAILSSGDMRYFTQNLEVYGMRFSIRPCSALGTGIDSVSHSSDLSTAGWVTSPTIIGETAVYNYRKNLNSSFFLNAENDSVELLPNSFVFCVDIIVKEVKVNNQRPSFFGFGFDVATAFSGLCVDEDSLIIIGDKVAGLSISALLSLPMFEMPDMSFIDDTLHLQNTIIGNYGDAGSSLGNLVSNFRRGLSSLSMGLSSVSALLEYFVGSTPIVGAIVTFSLVLGLLAFILSFSTSLTHAGSKSHSDYKFRSTSHSDYKFRSTSRSDNGSRSLMVKKGDDD